MGRARRRTARLTSVTDDEQPVVHEIGNRTYIVADVEPLDLDGVRTMQVGTALWLVVREGFGGVGRVSRKGDGGWRIR